jgi:hypothetical protein
VVTATRRRRGTCSEELDDRGQHDYDEVVAPELEEVVGTRTA